MNAVEVTGLVKNFNGFGAVNQVNLTVQDREFVTLLGPSGCGKSTTLRCIAGLESPDAGEIRVSGQVVTSVEQKFNVPTERRQLGMVFQSYAVWPHMTVFDNVAYPLKLRKVGEAQIQERVKKVLDMVQLTGLDQRYPSQLSGGQQQRVALARSLVYDPKVLLLDEPLSNLDAKLREQMRQELRTLQKRLNIAFIYVTHDQSEAMALSNRVVVMYAGQIVQIGTPREIYFRPTNRFVANFVGATNVVTGQLTGRENGYAVVQAPDGFAIRVADAGRVDDKGLAVAIRPERLRLSRTPEAVKGNRWQGCITDLTFLGNSTDYTVKSGDQTLQVSTSDTFETGEQVYVSVDPADCLIIQDA